MRILTPLGYSCTILGNKEITDSVYIPSAHLSWCGARLAYSKRGTDLWVHALLGVCVGGGGGGLDIHALRLIV